MNTRNDAHTTRLISMCVCQSGNETIFMQTVFEKLKMDDSGLHDVLDCCLSVPHRLVQIIDPQLIRKVNLVRSPFAWRVRSQGGLSPPT